MNCAPCITSLFSGHLACPVPEKGVSGTEYPSCTVEACFLHRMLPKMRRVPQEPVFCTARIFRTVGGPLWYRISQMPERRKALPGRGRTNRRGTFRTGSPTGTKKEAPTECYFNRDFRKAAAAYSPTWWGSTIGASELNFSVRYGKRWILTAITAAVCYLREISRLKSWLTQKISGY